MKVYLSGTSPPPSIATDQNILDFGSVKIGQGITDTLAIVNTSTNNDLSVSGITSSNAVFVASPTTGTVSPGDTLKVAVTFTPTAIVAYTDSLTISSNDPQNPTTKVYVSGSGDPIVAVSPSENALNVPVDSPISVTFGVEMNSATFDANSFVVEGSYTGKLSGSYIYDVASKTATFTPNQSYLVGERVYVCLTTDVQFDGG
ncbi:unnamed protein product, partial [marine sediment metagenome]